MLLIGVSVMTGFTSLKTGRSTKLSFFGPLVCEFFVLFVESGCPDFILL
jgi:hypothetical protein